MKEAPRPVDVEDAFAGIAVCAVAADGIVTEEEMGSLQAALFRLDAYRARGEDELRTIVERHFNALRDVGLDALLRRCSAALPEELRLSAYAVAADLVMTDHKVATRETRLLAKLRAALGVSDRKAARIEGVLRIKNRM